MCDPILIQYRNIQSHKMIFLLFSLDPELKEPLIEVIEKLLKDKTTVSCKNFEVSLKSKAVNSK